MSIGNPERLVAVGYFMTCVGLTVIAGSVVSDWQDSLMFLLGVAATVCQRKALEWIRIAKAACHNEAKEPQ